MGERTTSSSGASATARRSSSSTITRSCARCSAGCCASCSASSRRATTRRSASSSSVTRSRSTPRCTRRFERAMRRSTCRRSRDSWGPGSFRSSAAKTSSTCASSTRTTSRRRCSSTQIDTPISQPGAEVREMKKLAIAVPLLALVQGLATAQDAPADGAAAPKVILIIGDGMDQHQITIARDYLAGYDGRLTLDSLPVRSSVQIQTLAEEDPTVPEYVADSANTATSMATGIVTSAGRIGTTAGTDRDVPTIMELAAQAGIGTGIVATSSVTDATPASFVAHVSSRLCEGPRAMGSANAENPALATGCPADLKANGGKGSIAEQIAASRIDILLGGGQRHFAQPAEGETTKTVRDVAVANGFTVIGSASELASLPRGGKVLGLFAPGTMPVRWRGAGGAQAQRVQRDDTGRLVPPEPFSCEPDPAFGAMPTLAAMARAALTHLDDGRSFMLMIESASIDKQSHARRPCGSIGELKQLDDAVKLAVEYAGAHPETLVLVTADHSQAAQLVPERSWLGPNAASPGHFARIRTPEGAVMGVNYATNDSTLQEDHTGADVPLFAYGVAANDIPGQVRQTDVFRIMLRHLRLEAPPAP